MSYLTGLLDQLFRSHVEVKATQQQMVNMMTALQNSLQAFIRKVPCQEPATLTEEQEHALLLSGIMLPLQTVGEFLDFERKLQKDDFREAVVSDTGCFLFYLYTY